MVTGEDRQVHVFGKLNTEGIGIGNRIFGLDKGSRLHPFSFTDTTFIGKRPAFRSSRNPVAMEFDPVGFEDLARWIEKDRKKALKIIKLIKEVQRDPFDGSGKPEPLKHELSGSEART